VFTCVGWQVTLCDPIWQVTLRSCVMGYIPLRYSTFTFVPLHDCAMKYMTATRALTGGMLKLLNLSETLPVYLLDRLYLSAGAIDNKYCIFGRVRELKGP